MLERVWALGGRALFRNLKCEDIPCVYQPDTPVVETLVTVLVLSSAAKQLPRRLLINSNINRNVTIQVWILCRVQEEATGWEIIRCIKIMNGSVVLMADLTVCHRAGRYGLHLDDGLLISDVSPTNRALFEIRCSLTSYSLFSSLSNQWEEISPLGTFDSHWLTVLFQL